MNAVSSKKFDYYIIVDKKENKKVSKAEFIAFSQIRLSDKFFSTISADKCAHLPSYFGANPLPNCSWRLASNSSSNS